MLALITGEFLKFLQNRTGHAQMTVGRQNAQIGELVIRPFLGQMLEFACGIHLHNTDYLAHLERHEEAASIASKTAAEWLPIFDQADCCCSIMQDLQAALADPHFKARGVFAARLVHASAQAIPALPVPIVPPLRPGAASDASSPALGAHNAEFGL